MPTEYESLWSSYMLASLSHCEAGQRVYCGANAGERVCDGEILSQKSTYPNWYSVLCQTERGEAIRKNLALIAQGQENRRAGELTLGYKRALRAVQSVMKQGDDTGLVFPCPEYLEELGDFESAQAVREFTGAIAEAMAETPEDCGADDLPGPAALRETSLVIHPRAAAALPAILPFCAALEVRGWWFWPTPIDTEARLALENVGYKWSYKDQKLFGPPALAAKLPQRPCHSLPVITCTPY